MPLARGRERRADAVPHRLGDDAQLDVGREAAPAPVDDLAGSRRARPARPLECSAAAPITAPRICGVGRAVHVELDDDVAVLAEHPVPRAVEAVHVVLQPVAQRDARDREAVAGVVEQARQQLALLRASIAGRLVATTAASSATPCAGPEVGR